MGTLAGRLLRFVSIERVGASVTTTLNSLSPFVSTALAIVLLGEDVTMPSVAGTVVIVIGRLGLGTMSPVPGLAVNVTTALLAYTAALAAAGNAGGDGGARAEPDLLHRGRCGGERRVFLTLLALNLGTVSVVAPLNATSPIFALVLTLLFLRGIERPGARIVVGTLLTVLGVYLITAL